MPFLILYGGELVFLFLGARIARWMWRSREQVLALWRARHGAPQPSGPNLTPDPIAVSVVSAPEPAPLAARQASEPIPFRRAA